MPDPRFVEVQGVRIGYRRTGGDKPPFVLAHGFSDNGDCWASMIRVLARDYDVITYDARGHGASSAPDGGYDGEAQAEDLLGLIDALALEPTLLMGHSMGGETVAWATVKRPGAVRALILEDSGLPRPGFSDLDDERRENLRKGVARWMQSLQSKTVEELIEQVETNDPRWPEEDRRPWAESKLALSSAALDGFAYSRGRDLTEQYGAIACPVQFLMADAPDDERERQREIARRLSDVEVVHIDGAGHNVRRDEQARTVYQLGRFLARVR